MPRRRLRVAVDHTVSRNRRSRRPRESAVLLNEGAYLTEKHDSSSCTPLHDRPHAVVGRRGKRLRLLLSFALTVDRQYPSGYFLIIPASNPDGALLPSSRSRTPLPSGGVSPVATASRRSVASSGAGRIYGSDGTETWRADRVASGSPTLRRRHLTALTFEVTSSLSTSRVISNPWLSSSDLSSSTEPPIASICSGWSSQ